MRRLLAVTSLIASTGCALVPQPGPRPTVGPAYIPPPEPVWVVIDPALLTSTAPDPESPDPVRPSPPERTRRTSRASEVSPPVSDPRGPVFPPTGPDEPVFAEPRDTADSIRAVAARAALVSIDLNSEDQARLTRAARRNLADADSLAGLAGARLPAPRNPIKLATAQGLIRQAREALLRGDSRAAANLAYKARLLAAEADQ